MAFYLKLKKNTNDFQHRIHEDIEERYRELPPVAKRLIEIGKEKGVEIEITYGINCENENIIAGYWITAPQKNKQIFKQDIYVDDETEDNIRAAEKWMYHVLKELKRL